MKPLFNFTTGCVAISLMSAAVLATLHFIATNPEAGTKLASAMLSGIGSVLGAAIGGMLILRFKMVRRFIRNLFNEGGIALAVDVTPSFSFLKRGELSLSNLWR